MRKIYLKQALMTVHKKIEVTDEDQNLLYLAKSKFFTMHDSTTIENAGGDVIATLTKKILSLRAKYTVKMADGKTFSMHDELAHLILDVFDIEALGWTIRGNFVQHDYELLDRDGNILAAAHRKWLTLRQAYEIEVLNESELETIVVVLIVLEHVLFTRTETDTAVGADAISTLIHLNK